jgi:hypothetical protein
MPGNMQKTLLIFAVLGNAPRTLSMFDKHATTELHPQPKEDI